MSVKVEIKEITEIINEREFIDNILAEGYIDKVNTVKILGKLAKHYYWDCGYKQMRTVKALDAYMIAHYPDYNEYSITHYYGKHSFNSWERLYNRLYKTAIKTPICTANGIWITKSELIKIAELNNKQLEKLAFVCLCYAKLYKARNPNSTGWIYSGKYKDIFKQARIMCKAQDRFLMLSQLAERGYLYAYQLPPFEKWEKMSEYAKSRLHERQLDYKVTFIDDESNNVLLIDDWRELGYYYLRYKGENIIKCAKCGKLTRSNKTGTRKYCKSCTGNISKYEYDFNQYKCIDCGKLIDYENNLRQRAKKRCPECQWKERQEHNKKMYQQRKSKNSTI